MGGELFTPVPGRLSIDVWSDVMCPFCFLGDALLERALADFVHRDAVDVRYHSFLLQPDLARDSALSVTEMLAQKGMDAERVAALNGQIAERGRELGITFAFDRAIVTNMRAAHELLQFAATHDRQRALVRRLFAAFFSEGRNLGERAVLVELATAAGLDGEAAAEALAAETFAEAVDADVAAAGELGISGVPFFVFNGRYAVSGAQPVAAFSETLAAAWQESAA